MENSVRKTTVNIVFIVFINFFSFFNFGGQYTSFVPGQNLCHTFAVAATMQLLRPRNL